MTRALSRKRGVMILILVLTTVLVGSRLLCAQRLKAYRPAGWKAGMTQLRTDLGSGGFLLRRGPFVVSPCEELDDRWLEMNAKTAIYRFTPGVGGISEDPITWREATGDVTCCAGRYGYSQDFARGLRNKGIHQPAAIDAIIGDATQERWRGYKVISFVVSPSETMAAIVMATPFGAGIHGSPGLSGSPFLHYLQIISLTPPDTVTDVFRIPMRSRHITGDQKSNPIAVGWTADEAFVVCADRSKLCILDVAKQRKETSRGR